MSLWRSSGLRLEPMRTFLSGAVGDRDIHSVSSAGLVRGALFFPLSSGSSHGSSMGSEGLRGSIS